MSDKTYYFGDSRIRCPGDVITQYSGVVRIGPAQALADAWRRAAEAGSVATPFVYEVRQRSGSPGSLLVVGDVLISGLLAEGAQQFFEPSP